MGNNINIGLFRMAVPYARKSLEFAWKSGLESFYRTAIPDFFMVPAKRVRYSPETNPIENIPRSSERLFLEYDVAGDNGCID